MGHIEIIDTLNKKHLILTRYLIQVRNVPVQRELLRTLVQSELLELQIRSLHSDLSGVGKLLLLSKLLTI